MYKVTVTADGTTAEAAKKCRTIREAERVKNKLEKILKLPVQIDIVHIGRSR